MHRVLEDIIAHKRTEVAQAKAAFPETQLDAALAGPLPELRSFRDALSTGEGPRLITELKRKSPSAGLIRPDFDPVAIAKTYEANGARALSILTDDKFFGGSLEYLKHVRAVVDLPLLRKEFVVDPYQVKEARVAGADAVLIIVRILGDETLDACLRTAEGCGLYCLVEVHDTGDLQRAVSAGAGIIGVNNRDLDTLEIDLETTELLLPFVPDGVVKVSESGVRTHGDVVRLGSAGADAYLIGETLMKAPDIGAALRALRGKG